MSVTRRVAVVEDPRFAEHRGPTGHPERPDRLRAVHAAIARQQAALGSLPAREADDEEILRIHRPELLRAVRDAAAHAPAQLDPDTFVAPASFQVARLAAGAAIDLARAVARGELDAGFAAVRPPGHHAEAAHAMGFCLFNNVAIAARALQAEDGVERVAIVDWDVHHGNGTQHVFESDPTVYYVSLHQFPYYPGTGDFGEQGVGRGEGATLNVPLPAGCGDAEYVGVMQRVVAPALRAFRPDVLLVSAGFDAHLADPLASMTVSGAGFAALAAWARALADELCAGRLVHVLEGGYALDGLEQGVAGVLAATLAPPGRPLPPAVPAPPGSLLAQLIERVGNVHGRRIPDLGAA